MKSFDLNSLITKHCIHVLNVSDTYEILTYCNF